MNKHIYQHIMVSKRDRDLYRVKWGKEGRFYFIEVVKVIYKYGEDPLQFKISYDNLCNDLIKLLYEWGVSPRQIYYLDQKI